MIDDPAEALAGLAAEGAAALGGALAAAAVRADPGVDATGSVSVVLDAAGRVDRVAVVQDWRHRCGLDGLATAIENATRDAGERRLRAWGEQFSGGPLSPAGQSPLNRAFAEQRAFAQRLRDVTGGRLSDEERRASLLALVEAG